MKIKNLLLALMLSLPFALLVQADEPKNGPKKEHKPETELEGKMGEMGGAFRKLRGQIQDATKNAESIALVEKMRAAAVEAAKLKPIKTEDLPEADRAKFVAEFRKDIQELIGTFDKIAAALKAGDNAAAAKLIGDVRALQKEGHKEFMRRKRRKEVTLRHG